MQLRFIQSISVQTRAKNIYKLDLQRVAMWSVLWTNTIELTYEILGIRPLLIDKLSNYCIPKDGVLLPRMDSYSSVLPLIVDPFIIR
jgi:hypothetical protein